MNWEYSRGAVAFTRENGLILFAIVQEQAGAYPRRRENKNTREDGDNKITEKTGIIKSWIDFLLLI